MQWTQEETKIMYDLCSTHTWVEIALLLNRTNRSVIDKSRALKLSSAYRSTTAWSKLEIDQLKQLYAQQKTNTEISNTMDRTQTAISIKLSQLKLTTGPSRKVRLSKKDNIMGNKYRLLTVDRLSENTTHYGQRLWVCTCDCGGTKEVTKNHLEQNLVRSCGCLRIKKGNDNPRWKGYEEIGKAFWGGYLRGAKTRGYEFLITIEEGWNQFIKQNRKCALTGQPLNFSNNTSVSRHGTASLDRIDSFKDYTIDNVQWIHKDINRLKNNYEQQHFIEMCQLVTEYVNTQKKTAHQQRP